MPLSIIDIADWVTVSLQLTKAMGLSGLPSVHSVRQHPTAILEASTNNPQGLPNSKMCNVVALLNSLSTNQKHVDAQRSKKSYWRPVFSSNQ